MKYILFFLFSLAFCAQKSDVYFTKNITSEAIVEMYKLLNVTLTGKIGLKVHSGEPNGPYFLRREFLKDIYDHTGGTFIECNVAYNSKRLNTSTHKETLETNGWLVNNTRFDIMDENPEEDINITLSKHNKINVSYAGKHLEKYDSCIVLSHFKGHGMGGFGGALKQLSIGFASRSGKTWIHTAGKSLNYSELFVKKASQLDFTASMADAASGIVNYFKNKGGIVYINVLANISIDCDCAGTRAKEPKIHNIGILASTDPVAIDQACYDLIQKTKDEGTQAWLDRVSNLEGLNTIDSAVKLNIGTKDYNLIKLDGDDDETDGKTGSSSFLKLSLSLISILLLMFI